MQKIKKIFDRNTYSAGVTKVFKQSIIRYVNKLRYNNETVFSTNCIFKTIVNILFILYTSFSLLMYVRNKYLFLLINFYIHFHIDCRFDRYNRNSLVSLR